jgi:hypothetical protein
MLLNSLNAEEKKEASNLEHPDSRWNHKFDVRKLA